MNERVVTLRALHAGQREIACSQRRWNVLCAARRYGKSLLGQDRLVRPALKRGIPTAWVSPTYKMLSPIWREVKATLAPVTVDCSEQEHRLALVGGGVVEFWSFDAIDSVRGRKYGRLCLDECAMVGGLESAWHDVLRPTLTDLRGDAWFLSTPRGRGFFWTAFQKGQDPLEDAWASWQRPTSGNPYIHPDEIAEAERDLPERSFQQEYLAEFLSDSGGVFRGVYAVVDRDRSANEDPVAGATYTLGVDLARKLDFSVLNVMGDGGRQVYHERFNEVSWPRQLEAIERVARRYHDAACWIDATGLGDPIAGALLERGVQVVPYQFSNASKARLIDSLAMAIEGGVVSLLDQPIQTSELLAYEYSTTASRMVRTSAPTGGHDDCVHSLALAHMGAQNASGTFHLY